MSWCEFRGSLTISNSTISGNAAVSKTSLGGGIYAGGPTISNSTISGNSAAGGGGIYRGAIFQNSIVANSPSGGNCSGTMTSNVVQRSDTKLPSPS